MISSGINILLNFLCSCYFYFILRFTNFFVRHKECGCHIVNGLMGIANIRDAEHDCFFHENDRVLNDYIRYNQYPQDIFQETDFDISYMVV